MGDTSSKFIIAEFDRLFPKGYIAFGDSLVLTPGAAGARIHLAGKHLATIYHRPSAPKVWILQVLHQRPRAFTTMERLIRGAWLDDCRPSAIPVREK
jgi:hypothetical protein